MVKSILSAVPEMLQKPDPNKAIQEKRKFYNKPEKKHKRKNIKGKTMGKQHVEKTGNLSRKANQRRKRIH